MGTRLLWIDPTLLVDLYKAGPPCVTEAVENPLPADAMLIGVRYDLTRDTCALVLESADWPAVPVGTPLPVVPAPAVGVHYEAAARLAAWAAFAALVGRGMRVQAVGQDTGSQVWADVQRAYHETLRRLGCLEAFDAQLEADEADEEEPPDLNRWWALPEPVAGPGQPFRGQVTSEETLPPLVLEPTA